MVGSPAPDQEHTSDEAAAAQNPALIPQQTVSTVIRYNVTAVDGLFASPPTGGAPNVAGIQLSLRYLDAGSNARVVARLIEVDFATGVETVRLTFDSNTFPSASRYQVRSVSDCGPLWGFDFKQKGYYVEATLSRNSILAGSAAGIQMIQIEHVVCRG